MRKKKILLLQSVISILLSNLNVHAISFPIDTNILIPTFNSKTESSVRIEQLDTNLVFTLSLGTLSCPGHSNGDIKNVIKIPTNSNPHPLIDTPLWTETRQCSSNEPNSLLANVNFYEYQFSNKGRPLYLSVLKYVGVKTFTPGADPQLEFQIEIDTVSHLNASSIFHNGITKIRKTADRKPLFMINGKKLAENKINSK